MASLNMASIVRKIMDNGIVPAHAPNWNKVTDDQWMNKLIHMAEHPEKYQDSLLKNILLKACEMYR